MESTVRNDRQTTKRRVGVSGGYALVLVATPVAAARWTVRPLGATTALERVMVGDDADALMSRLHATVTVHGDDILLRDGAERDGEWRPSANGTLDPTGRVVDEDGVRLSPGQTFQTGDSLWLVIRGTELQDERTLLKGYSAAVRRAHENLQMVVNQSVRRLETGRRLRLSLLVTGPRGSGKQVVAREAHRLLCLQRPRAPFRQVSAPSLGSGTTAADLFGVVDHYATDVRARSGFFEQAHGGVLLLDEVGDTPPDVQATLLNALQEREVVPLGGKKPIPFDALVVAATNQPLDRRDESAFRRDLIDRLATFQVVLPPLRERPEDIPVLVRHILEDIGSTIALDAAVMRALMLRWWPGNVRQLRSVMERLVALADLRGDAPDVAMLDRAVEDGAEGSSPRSAIASHVAAEPAPSEPGIRTQRIVKRPDVQTLIEGLNECGGNRSELARRWGTEPRQIRRWVAYYDLKDV